MAPGSRCSPAASRNSRAGGIASWLPIASTAPSRIATLAGIAASGDTTVPLWMTRSAVVIGTSQHGPTAIDRKIDAGDLTRHVARQEQAGVRHVRIGRNALERIV